MVTTNLSTSQRLDANGRVLHEAPALMMRQEVDGNNYILYIGLAVPGSAASGAVWQIRKFTNNASGVVTLVEYADGNNLFDNIWSSRTTLSYS